MIKTKKAIAEVVRLDGPVLNEGVEDKKIRDLPLEESKWNMYWSPITKLTI